MHTTNPAGLALLVRGTDLPSRLQSWLPDVPVACAATAAELATLLRDPRWRAVAIEASVLGDRAEELLSRLAALFPDVPLIAIGSSGDARRFEPLVASGCIQRFLRHPLGRKRTRACLESVLARPDCAARAPLTRVPHSAGESGNARDGTLPQAAAPGFALPRAFARAPHLELTRGARRALAALAALAALMGLAAVVASGSGASTRSAAGDMADARAAPATEAPPSRAAHAGPTAVRLPTPHTPPLAGHVVGARVVVNASAALPVDVTPLLAAAADAKARGALLDPDGDNAVHYYRIAMVAAPADGRARLALADLGTALLAAGEQALATRRYSEGAARAEQAAQVLGDDARVRDLQARARSGLEGARQRADARREAWAQAAREWSAAAAAAVPPANAIGGEHG